MLFLCCTLVGDQDAIRANLRTDALFVADGEYSTLRRLLKFAQEKQSRTPKVKNTDIARDFAATTGCVQKKLSRYLALLILGKQGQPAKMCNGAWTAIQGDAERRDPIFQAKTLKNNKVRCCVLDPQPPTPTSSHYSSTRWHGTRSGSQTCSPWRASGKSPTMHRRHRPLCWACAKLLHYERMRFPLLETTTATRQRRHETQCASKEIRDK
jgi:hypothetical protein